MYEKEKSSDEKWDREEEGDAKGGVEIERGSRQRSKGIWEKRGYDGKD